MAREARRASTRARRIRGPERIAIVAPPWVPIPPPAYGGIENVVALQAEVLAAAGHDVTLICAPGSRVPGVHCVAPLASIPSVIGHHQSDWDHALAAEDLVAGHDVVVDHSGPLSTLLLSGGSVPVLHVTHGELHDDARRVYAGIGRAGRQVGYVAISAAQRQSAPELPFAGVCHNAIDLDPVPVGDGSGGYLAFLGRMSPDKGAKEAIAIAREAGLPIRMAAKCREPDEIRYFEEHVEPLLGDDVDWLGEISTHAKYALLGNAAALVFPIAWPEPFGMVMIESMACGTPVIATPCGAVPEVVAHGSTGFVGPISSAADAVGRIGTLSRDACREHVQTHFGPAQFGRRWQHLLAATTVARFAGEVADRFALPA